jgi:low affinity Fe/Cu permease
LISDLTAAAGSFSAILISLVLVVVWLLAAPFVRGGFANTNYQLIVSTVSSIVTFVMVFVIQSSQNRDNRAMQAKLDAQSTMLAHLAQALDVQQHRFLLTRLVGLEDAPDDEIAHEQERVRNAAARTAYADYQDLDADA